MRDQTDDVKAMPVLSLVRRLPPCHVLLLKEASRKRPKRPAGLTSVYARRLDNTSANKKRENNALRDRVIRDIVCLRRRRVGGCEILGQAPHIAEYHRELGWR